MTTFKELGLDNDLLDAIQKMGFENPTEIQEKTIPLGLQKKDIIAGSETGSGKTLAFGVPIVQHSNKKGGVQALILTPTRELAEQITAVMKTVSKPKKLQVTSIYGGVSINPQIKALEKADIVVGTPGRILDHLQRQTLDLSFVKHLVLDEADRMLDMGFFDDVQKIIQACPSQKQVLLFSATIHSEVAHLAKKFMDNPQKITAGEQVDPSKLHQVYYDVSSRLKFSLLAHLLQQDKGGLVMVFCNSRRFVDIISRNLKNLGIPAMGIHGGLSQQQRNFVLEKFNSKEHFVLVCTDVASRGLDISGVSHVYNYDIPDDPKQYIHRIGRTARAGKSGLVVNLISERDYQNFSRIWNENDFTIERVERPYVKEMNFNAHGDSRGKQRRNYNQKGQSSRGGPRQRRGGPRGPRNASKSGSPRGSRGPRKSSFQGGSRKRTSDGRRPGNRVSVHNR